MYSRCPPAFATFALLIAAPAMAEASKDVVGHYYLQGVRETGSELLLMPDGRFQWYLAYGALDQNADGTWTRKGDVVTLTSKGPDRSKPLFLLDEQVPWEAAHERAVLEKARADRIAELDGQCPLPPSAAVFAPPAIMSDGNAEAPSAPEPDVAPDPPPGCAYPPEVRVDDDHPDLWTGGIIIGIADPEMGVAPKGVKVTLTWADGHKQTAPTASRGWALFPKRAGVKASHVELDPPFAAWGKAAFDFPPLEKGLQAFRIDARQVMAVPFETMTLRVDGADLIPEGLAPGRYVKGSER